LLIDILWKLSNIPTEVTMAKSGCWLLTPTHKMTHCFSVLIQPPHFRSTPSSLVIEINSENQDTDIWARWKCIVPYCNNYGEYFQKRFSKIIGQ
jgi:hypothetical protein